MNKERKFHVNFEEALIATTSGVVFGIAAGSAMYLKTPPLEATKMALTCVPLALIGLDKVVTRKRIYKTKRRRSSNPS